MSVEALLLIQKLPIGSGEAKIFVWMHVLYTIPSFPWMKLISLQARNVSITQAQKLVGVIFRQRLIGELLIWKLCCWNWSFSEAWGDVVVCSSCWCLVQIDGNVGGVPLCMWVCVILLASTVRRNSKWNIAMCFGGHYQTWGSRVFG